MPWVRIDEHFPEHPKVAALDELEPLCGWLDLKAKCWCNATLTDGKISRAQVRRLAATFLGCIAIDRKPVTVEMLTARLVDVGMWERDGDDFAVHDYLEYQPSRAQVLADREKKAEAGRLGGKRSGEQRRSKAEALAKQPASPVVAQCSSKTEAETKPVPVPGSVPLASYEAREDARAPEPSDAVRWGMSPLRASIPPLPSNVRVLITTEVRSTADKNGCTDPLRCLEHWHAKRWAKRNDARLWCTDWLADFIAWLCEHRRYGGACQKAPPKRAPGPPLSDHEHQRRVHAAQDHHVHETRVEFAAGPGPQLLGEVLKRAGVGS